MIRRFSGVFHVGFTTSFNLAIPSLLPPLRIVVSVSLRHLNRSVGTKTARPGGWSRHRRWFFSCGAGANNGRVSGLRARRASQQGAPIGRHLPRHQMASRHPPGRGARHQRRCHVIWRIRRLAGHVVPAPARGPRDGNMDEELIRLESR